MTAAVNIGSAVLLLALALALFFAGAVLFRLLRAGKGIAVSVVVSSFAVLCILLWICLLYTSDAADE